MTDTRAIHDLHAEHDRLIMHYDRGMALARGLALSQGHQPSPVVEPFDLALALGRARRRYERHMGMASKYRPHQGKRECARRIRQGKA